MIQILVQFWFGWVQTFGSIGALLVMLVLMVLVVSSSLTLMFVWRLYRKSDLMESRLVDLMGVMSRQQQVARLEHDRDRKKPRPRRRRSKSSAKATANGTSL